MGKKSPQQSRNREIFHIKQKKILPGFQQAGNHIDIVPSKESR